MGRVECFSLPGVDCWFYSNDHPPEHFHARSPGEWEVRVYFLRDPVDIEEAWRARRIPRGVLRQLAQLGGTHRLALFGEWDRKVAGE
jgi:hypothetical protein